MTDTTSRFSSLPDERGHFGPYGGRYVPEMLRPPLEDLTAAYAAAKSDPGFARELARLLATFSGRPTPLYHAERLSGMLGGARIYLKQEGLGQTGAHKINHCLGQALLAARMGKRRLIAETGAGQHGLAVATVAARFGMACTVYMGEVDVRRQATNVFWMRQLGATVVPVAEGTRTLKDAVNAAMKDWMWNAADSYFLCGSALGPHPYPMIVRDFQSVVGREVRAQIMEAEGRLPDLLVACVGGGSNSLGLFHPFLDDPGVAMVGVEAGGHGTDTEAHAARFAGGELGVIEGYKSYFLQTPEGQVRHTHSVSAGLDYAGIGPELAYLHDAGRVTFTAATDAEAIDAFTRLMRAEGIIPALESAHAVAHALKAAPGMRRDQLVVVNVSGRGDKDIFIVAEYLNDQDWKTFLRDMAEGKFRDEIV
ncbi:MAG TPA: tryptophan synthase subunit beta [Planctomycetes bacterium]|nr:tryptophan synthase subunit beta [Planctomycetota bacterium]